MLEVTQRQADEILQGLRSGIPSKRYVSTYSAGYEALMRGVDKRILKQPAGAGQIKFLSGSWGAGKTHLLRLLAERAYERNYWVSTVELGKSEAPFNQFEKVFARVIRHITDPDTYRSDTATSAVPFGSALERGLRKSQVAEEPISAVYARERARLFGNDTIDIDVRRAVDAVWQTFTADVDQDEVDTENRRQLVLQWFQGEGQISSLRREFGLQKMPNRSNAQGLFQSVGRLAQHLGYSGVLVLLDEAEMSYSTMRRSNLKDAHNNLLTLINTISESDGLILVYAATPDFYEDNNYGIKQYGALAGRIGSPEEAEPRALQRVWNIDAVQTSPEDFHSVASHLRDLYIIWDDESEDVLPQAAELTGWVDEVVGRHPQYSQISVWRWLVTALTRDFDARLEGDTGLTPEKVSRDILDELASMEED